MNTQRVHQIAYAVLALLLAGGAASFMLLWPNVPLVRATVVVFALSYVVWGCVTHVKTNRFTWKVAEEYAAIALLGGVLLMLITFSVR